MRSKVPAVFVVLCIAVYFFCLAGPGLLADFTFDDLANLYFAWIRPVPELIRANLLFFLPPSRALGRLFYALGFQFVGLNPALYHVVCFVFLCANIYLTYCFTLRLTGSRQIAALACLIHSYHGSAAALYYNSGTCYDVFCLFFYLGAFTLYISIRQQGRFPRRSQIALLVGLYIAALNAKEMAVTLPLLMACYELLYHHGESWRRRSVSICVMSLTTAAYVLGITRGEESLTKLEGYKPTFSAASYLLQTRSFLNDSIYSVDWFNGRRSLTLLTALFAIAWISRNRELRFCWLFLTIGVLPIAFIPPRGLYAAYIPTVGLAIFLAIVLERAIRLVGSQPMRVGLFVVAALVLAAIHKNKGESNVAWISAEERQIRNVILQVSRLRPEVPAGSRILLLKDPFEGRVWDSTFLLRLFYRDNSLVVDRGPDERDTQKYDYVWDFEQGKLREVGEINSLLRRTP